VSTSREVDTSPADDLMRVNMAATQPHRQAWLTGRLHTGRGQPPCSSSLYAVICLAMADAKTCNTELVTDQYLSPEMTMGECMGIVGQVSALVTAPAAVQLRSVRV
jgi:hypothetical protein